jgi:flagellar biosynthesis chaperone FliJ
MDTKGKMYYEHCSNCEKFVSDLDWKDKEIEKFKAEIQRLETDLKAANEKFATIIDELTHFHKRVDKVGKITVAESWGAAIDKYVKELNKHFRAEAEKEGK